MTAPPSPEIGMGTHKINVARSKAKDVRRQSRIMLISLFVTLAAAAGWVYVSHWQMQWRWWWIPALAALTAAQAGLSRWCWCQGWLARDERRWAP